MDFIWDIKDMDIIHAPINLEYFQRKMDSAKPLMIIQANLKSITLKIYEEDSLPSKINEYLTTVNDKDSPFFIESEYLMNRLLNCFKTALSYDSYNSQNCPIMFDSWSCWNSTSPGFFQYSSCPNFVNLGFTDDKMAEKECMEDGTWWIHPDTNR